MLTGRIPAAQGECLHATGEQSGGTQLQHEKRFISCRAVLVSRATKNSREDILMKHLSAVAIAVLIGTAAFQFSNPVSGQSDCGWITFVDITKMWVTGMRSARPIGR